MVYINLDSQDLACSLPNHFARALIFPESEKDWLAQPIIHDISGSVISTDGVDGLHFTPESHHKLGAAIATKVKDILK